uniref:Ribosome-recycling factor, mitochondrial n=1 Tax=Trichuris muris TaxID=70415 RepID=A0A5S6Q9C8_TRIMR
MWAWRVGPTLRRMGAPSNDVARTVHICSLKLAIDKGGKKRRVIRLDDKDAQQYIDVAGMSAEMDAELTKLKDQYRQQLSMQNVLRAFETLQVKPPGSKELVPLNTIAQITLKNPRMAIINLASAPEAIKAVTEAIDKSGMDVGYQQQSNLLYVPIPRPSKEKRENMAKNAKLLCNQCHDRLRTIMRSYEIKIRYRKDEIPRDVYTSVLHYVEETMRSYAHKGELLMAAKQSELLGDAK